MDPNFVGENKAMSQHKKFPQSQFDQHENKITKY
jgi:hypothetical protein